MNTVLVNLDGQQVVVVIESGGLGAAASIDMAALNAAVAEANAAATEAENAATTAVAATVNKLDRDGDNASAGLLGAVGAQYPDLTAISAPVVDSDVLAAFRLGLKRLTASQFADYVKAFFSASGGAALVGFLAAGTGAVLRTVQTKLRENVSVKDFGAVGDSTGASGSGTDDTAAIQAAIDYAAATPFGCSIYFPRGVYRVTSELNISVLNKQNRIYGDVVYGSKVFRDSATDGKTFNIGSGTYESDSLIFERLMVGPSVGVGAGGANDTLIHVEKRGGIKFRDLLLSGGRQQINLALLGWSTIIERVQFNGSAGNALVTNAADASANHLVVRDCRVFSCGLTLSAIAFQINTAVDVSVLQCNFEGNYNALYLNDVDGALVEGNHFERNNQHMYFQSTCENIDVNANYFGEKLGGGVCSMTLENVTGCDFTNNSMFDTAVAFGSTSMDVDVGAYHLDGAATLALPILSSMRRFNKKNRNYTSAAPVAAGTYERGDRVFNDAPVVGGNADFVCVSGGTSGTWGRANFIALDGSATYDPPSLADGVGVTTTVTATGAALGDFAMASFSNDLQGILMTAWVSAANTVSVRFQNETTGVIDLASGTLRVRVQKQ
jgi:hypothetical protein